MAERKSISKTRKPGAKALVSVVLSFRNEADVLIELIRRLEAVMAEQPEDLELVFVNDDSDDASLELLTEARTVNQQIKIYIEIICIEC